jgi:hypothetical protein
MDGGVTVHEKGGALGGVLGGLTAEEGATFQDDGIKEDILLASIEETITQMTLDMSAAQQGERVRRVCHYSDVITRVVNSFPYRFQVFLMEGMRS